tara:strand:+ start:61 stop:393 length:333 start_codon:yes stop_codon:yes gene_type:complete
MNYKKMMGYSNKKKVVKEKKIQKPKKNTVLENIIKEFGYVNETVPKFPKEWKNLEKACDVLEKAVYNLTKAVDKQDRKSAKALGGLWKYTYKNIEKFKELVSKEILSKLQ